MTDLVQKTKVLISQMADLLTDELIDQKLLILSKKTLQSDQVIKQMSSIKKEIIKNLRLILENEKIPPSVQNYFLRRLLYNIDKLRAKSAGKMVIIIQHAFPLELSRLFLGPNHPSVPKWINTARAFISSRANLLFTGKQKKPGTLRKVSVKYHPYEKKLPLWKLKNSLPFQQGILSNDETQNQVSI